MARNDGRVWKRGIRFAATTALVAITVTFIAGLVPNGVAAHAATETPVVFRSLLGGTAASGRIATEPALAMTFAARVRTATVIAPVIVAAPKPTVKRTTASTSTSTAAAPAPDELAQAQSILAGLIAQHPILAGTTVSFGDARGSQAIAYYKSGRVVISPTHTASLSRILNHEIWHIIDWRDNGVIDWGENVPPN